MPLETPQIPSRPQQEAKVTSIAAAQKQKQAQDAAARLLLLSIRLQIMQKPD